MSQSFIKRPSDGPHSALNGLGVLRSEQPSAAPTAWLLYEHDDGRHAVAPSAEAATFAKGDPAWHRVGPVEVYLALPGQMPGDGEFSQYRAGWNACLEEFQRMNASGQALEESAVVRNS